MLYMRIWKNWRVFSLTLIEMRARSGARSGMLIPAHMFDTIDLIAIDQKVSVTMENRIFCQSTPKVWRNQNDFIFFLSAIGFFFLF